MTDRDTFAAAALTGLIACMKDEYCEEICESAYWWADAMLRERGKEQGHEDNRSQPSKRKWVHGCTGILRDGEVGMEETDDGPVYKIGDGKTEWDDLPTLVKSTNHDDAATGEPSGGVGFSSGSSSDPINRNAERESPRRECGESALRDVPQLDNSRAAGGPEHHISEAEIDALEFVVEEGRIVGMSVYGHLRSLLVKLRPEWESDRPQPIKYDLSDRSNPVAPAVTVGGVDRPVSYAETDQNRIFYGTKRDTTQPRNGALSGCETVPDPDSRVWETPRTPQPHPTPPQGSVQDEGSFRDSRNAKEPVAWAVETGGELEASFCGRAGREDAADWREQSDGVIVPLYRHPHRPLGDPEIAVELLKDRVAELERAFNLIARADGTMSVVGGNVVVTVYATLTDEEREAVERAAGWLDRWQAAHGYHSREDGDLATLRGLLERLK